MSGSSVRAISEQLRYLADELDAQQEILEIVPEPLRAAEPIPGQPSIARFYGYMLLLEARVNAPVCAYLGGLDDKEPTLQPESELMAEAAPTGSLPEILSELRDERLALVAALESLPDIRWTAARPLGGRSVTLKDYAYLMTQSDVAILRRVTQRMYEGQMGAPPSQ